MAKRLQKFVYRCLSKIKNPYPQIESSSSRNWILSGCKQSRTPSFAIARRKDDAATLSDIDRFLSENFTTLFNEDEEDTPSSSNNNNIHNNNNNNHNNAFTRVFGQENLRDSRSTSNSPDSARFPDLASPDLAGSSESIAVLRRSASPQQDFGRSMMEMVETRLENGERVDWAFMQELLFCYLNLNKKKWHGFILSAFVDLVNTLCGRAPPATAKPRSVRTVRVGRKKKTEVRLAFEEKKIAMNANKGCLERSIAFD